MTARSAARIIPPAAPPFLLEWTADSLPRRTIRAIGRHCSLAFGMTAAPHLDTGPSDRPFDFDLHICRLVRDIACRSSEFRHIDTRQILFTVTQSRNGRKHGLQARVTPLRFQRGELIKHHRGGRYYQVQRFQVDKREILYLMTFCLPRYLNLDFDEKVVTLFHEMYHISPAFDGDLRRHEGRYQVHSHSQKSYDEKMAKLARAYLASGPDKRLHDFLRLNFGQLRHKHGSITGVHVPRPRMLAVRSPTEY